MDRIDWRWYGLDIEGIIWLKCIDKINTLCANSSKHVEKEWENLKIKKGQTIFAFTLTKWL